MDGLERLSKQLGHTEVPEPQNFDNKTNDKMAVEGVADALETTVTTRPSGVNKAPPKKTRKGRKYSYMHRGKGPRGKDQDQKEKPKPKYFCQF